MKLTVIRYSTFLSYGGSTFGLLFVDNGFFCYTLEDEERTIKVPGETCIPTGIYKIALRKFGRHHEEYAKRFPDIHQGMLEIKDVPGFTDILIHILNYETQTEGCLGVGDTVNNNTIGQATLKNSEQAYKRLYTTIIGEINIGKEVTIEYRKFKP